jgi:hypothetical protein
MFGERDAGGVYSAGVFAMWSTAGVAACAVRDLHQWVSVGSVAIWCTDADDVQYFYLTAAIDAFTRVYDPLEDFLSYYL